MQTTHTTPTYLTARDVQELIRVDRSTIYRMAESGRLPAIKIGRQWRFPSEAIHEWLGTPSNGDPGTVPRSSKQNVADLFAELYGVMVIVTDITGNPLPVSATRVATSPLCPEKHQHLSVVSPSGRPSEINTTSNRDSGPAISAFSAPEHSSVWGTNLPAW